MEQNPITNTLFRFVSLRGVQLASDDELAARFIRQPATQRNSDMYDAVTNRPPGTTKLQALRLFASTFTPTYGSVEEVAGIESTLFTFGVWVARNRTTCTIQELTAEVAKVQNGVGGTEENLWLDLFYYLVTQSSPYMVDVISQMLIANHIVENYHKDEEDFIEIADTVLHSEIALPVELFDASADAVKGKQVDTTARPAVPNRFFKKKLVVVEEKNRIEALEQLREEVVQSRQTYEASYQVTYQHALEQYEDEVAHTYQTYREAKEEARATFCSNQGSSTLPYDPNDPCQQPPYVPEPSISPFIFEFSEEVNYDKMEAELSAAAFTTLKGLLGFNFKTNQPGKTVLFRNHSTYNDVLSTIDKASEGSLRKISDNATVLGKKVRVNGISFRTSDMGVTAPFQFTIFTSALDLSRIFTLNLGVPDETWQIIKITVNGTKPNNSTFTQEVSMPNAESNFDSLTLSGFYTYTANDVISAPPVFDFDILFSNGKVKRINDISLAHHHTEGIATDAVPTDPPADVAFVPPVGGYRNLGSADYLRLEQTVHCYVEGEISHIENIMAREYKEKATRILRRNEETTTSSAEKEAERLSDTTSTNRFEMQSEINQVIAQSKDFSGFVSAGMTMVAIRSTPASTMRTTPIGKTVSTKLLPRLKR